MYEELLDRAARSESGRADNAALDRILQDSEQPIAQKRWAVYLNAEINRRIGRYGRAQQWLNAAGALSPEAAPLVWIANMSSCQADVELAFDEPDRALRMADQAWRQHLAVSTEALSSEEALAALLGAIDDLFAGLCRIADADANVAVLLRRSSWANDRLVHGVITDARRLIRLAGSLGAFELARDARSETIAWSENLMPFLTALTSGRLDEERHMAAQAVLESSLRQMRNVVRIELDTQLGDAADACRQHEEAMRLFDEAAQLAGHMGDSPYWEDKVLQLELNSANQLAKLDRDAEAQTAYEDVLARCRPGSDKIAIACRFGMVGCRWRQAGGSTGLADQMEVVADLESMFLAEPEDGWVRAMLLSAYRLLVNMVAKDQTILRDRLSLLLQVLYAIRTPDSVAMLTSINQTATYSARFGVDVLLSRWSTLEGAVLLVWETGATDLVLTTLASGSGPLAARIQVTCLPIDRANLLIDCIEATRTAGEQISMRAVGLKRRSATAMEQKARAVWNAFPVSVQNMLLAADTIYYSPSNQSALDEFPLEALHDGESFLGTKKVICRVPSLHHLSDVLATNRYRQIPPARALLVRAKDPQRTEDDGTVKQQASLIAAAVEELNLHLETLDEPSVDTFGRAVDAPTRLLHFIGHGFAGEGGEVLVLSEMEQVPIAHVLSPGGDRAPFTYFSACEVGRGRQMPSGAQRGLAATFLDAGAPAILAPAYRIPSHFLGLFAAVFYQQCASLPAGVALMETRKLLHAQQYHPACWATMALFGDPYASLTDQASAARPERSDSWKSLVFQYVATQDPRRQHMCLEALKSDPQLSADVKTRISQWFQDGTVDSKSIPSLLEKLQSQDPEASALLEILWTIHDVKDVNTESPQEAQESARARLQRCFDAARALEDSYATICVIEAIGGVGVRMDSLGNYRQLLNYEQILLERLSADSTSLDRIAAPLSDLRQQLDNVTTVNLGTGFGYSDEDINQADQGDPGALRRVALSMLERSARPEALTGVSPWYVWLLRWGGTGTASSCGNVLAALEIDVKAGRLSEVTAAAIRNFVGELQFSSPLDPIVVRAAFEAVEPGSLEFGAMQLMWVKDRIETNDSVSLSDVQDALAFADDLRGVVGDTGIAAWFRTTLASHQLATGETESAAQLLEEAVSELAILQEPSQDFTTRLARAVQLAMLVAEARGDSIRIERLQEAFADVLATAGSDEQRLRDDHGYLAEYAQDFRPSSAEH